MSTPASTTVDELPADPGGDFYAPLFLTVDPDGQIAFDFEGHIHALGLDFDAAALRPGGDHNRVRWNHETSGGVVAEVLGYSLDIQFGDARGLDVIAYGQSAQVPRDESVRLQAVVDDDQLEAELEVGGRNIGGGRGGFLTAGARQPDGQFAQKTILDCGFGDERSDFLQIAGGAADWRLRVLVVSFDPPNLPANANATWLIPLPAGSAAVGDVALQAAPTTAFSVGIAAAIGLQADVVQADQVRFRVRNVTGAAIDQPASDWTIVVLNRS